MSNDECWHVMWQTLEAQLKEEMDALVAASSSHSIAAMASCTEQTSVLVSQWEHIGQHGKDTDAGLLQLVDDVQTFLQQDLHRDMPTGIFCWNITQIFSYGKTPSV
jgi:hypothetical protein